MAEQGVHKLKMNGQELDSRLDQVKTNESQISANKEALDANAAADAELRSRVENLAIPTKVSELENDSRYVNEAFLEDYAKKSDIPQISGAAKPADVEALKKQFASLSEYVLENTESQIINEIPEGGLGDLNYESQNIVFKGTSGKPLNVNCPVTVVANSVIVKDAEITTKNTNVRLTAKA